jgi:putative tricarboxylic transport membrane protein
LLEQLLNGLLVAMQPENFILGFFGVAVGMLVGVLPGLDASTGVALLLPLTYTLGPIPALIMLCGIYQGGQTGGAITAILVRIPGTSSSAAGMIDGNEMAKQGRGGAAIGMAVISSTFGGFFGIAVLIVSASQLAKVAISFGPAEYFALGVFGLSIICSLTEKSITKAIIAGCAGFLISSVGIDKFAGAPRFTFGRVELLAGVDLLPVFIGFFAGAEALRQAETAFMPRKIVVDTKAMLPTLKELRDSFSTMIRSSIIGTFIGVLPGAGSTIAAFLAYGEGKRWSKHPELYGTGFIEGVAAAETADNASVGGAMVPMLTLGIPGSGTTAIMLGALMVQGIQPGPHIFVKNADVVYALYGGLIIACFMMFIVGMGAARYFALMLKLPDSVISAIILPLCVVGAFSMNNSLFDVWLMICFSVVGYLMLKGGIPITPLVLGYVLGPMVETNLRRAMVIYNGDFFAVLGNPVAGVFFVLALFALTKPILVFLARRIRKAFISG